MLSLKDLSIRPRVKPRLTINDLPPEILGLIISYVNTGYRTAHYDVAALSLVCKTLREASIPTLFSDVHLATISHLPDSRTSNILEGLTRSGLDKHVRCIIEHASEDKAGLDPMSRLKSYSLANPKLGLSQFSSLREMRLLCIRSSLIYLLCSRQQDFPVTIIVNNPQCEPRGGGDVTTNEEFYNYLKRRPEQYQDRLGVWLQSGARGDVYTKPFTSECPKQVTALMSSADRMLTEFASLETIEELHLTPYSRRRKSRQAGVDAEIKLIQKALTSATNLKRVCVMGVNICSALFKVVSTMQNLTHLEIESEIEGVFHEEIHNHEFQGLPYLRLPRLSSLSIRYISSYLSMQHAIPPGLKRLRIQHASKTERLKSYDLLWIASHAPNIEHLEVDIGSLTNLWHPTAIAGVDVDVEVYSVLNALSSFKNLHTLRLFPHYISDRLATNLLVSDEQAIRIFNHLRLRNHKLQNLFISITKRESTDPVYVMKRYQAMKWHVHRSGSKTILRTYQLGRNYELEQIWGNDGKLIVKTIRHAYPHLYHDELDKDWCFSVYELERDEFLRQCQN